MAVGTTPPRSMQYFTEAVEPLDQSHDFEVVYLQSEDDLALPPGVHTFARLRHVTLGLGATPA